MKCLVAVKRVVDYNVKVQVKSDCSGVETNNVKMSMNPFDEIAIEEAVRLKEKGIINEITAVSIGQNACKETLRVALARGADKAILIETNHTYQPLVIAKILEKIIIQEPFDLVLLGKQAIDGDNNQTGQMLAARLNWPQGTFASKIEIDKNAKTALVTREVDTGLETIKITLPGIITTDLRLNEPRYISLPNVMQAKKKPLDIVPLETLRVDIKNHINILKVTPPPVRKPGIIVESVDALIDKLKNEAKII